ncbi:MAG: serine/threonine-protein kinase [Myxococcota bacterium]
MSGLDLQDDRFRLEQAVGEGGTARVFRGVDVRTGATVAVKVLREQLLDDPECLARFEMEAQLLKELDHPNLLPVVAVGNTKDGMPWFASAFASRGSLADQMVRTGVLQPEELLRYATEVLDCLHYLHGLGIVHRDIKPENILVDDDDVAMLCDLGIARAPSRRATMVGDRMGTPSFMPPEQYDDPSSVNATADLFGLGVTMFVGLTGQTGMVLLVEHLRGKALAALPPAIRTIVDRATRVKPEERYPSAWAMSLDVADALEGS